MLAMSGFAVHAQELAWNNNLEKAVDISKKTKKPLMLFFTGSDWCGWCQRLQRDVFVKPEFIAWAKKNVILLELDFPRRKHAWHRWLPALRPVASKRAEQEHAHYFRDGFSRLSGACAIHAARRVRCDRQTIHVHRVDCESADVFPAASARHTKVGPPNSRGPARGT